MYLNLMLWAIYVSTQQIDAHAKQTCLLGLKLTTGRCATRKFGPSEQHDVRCSNNAQYSCTLFIWRNHAFFHDCGKSSDQYIQFQFNHLYGCVTTTRSVTGLLLRQEMHDYATKASYRKPGALQCLIDVSTWSVNLIMLQFQLQFKFHRWQVYGVMYSRACMLLTQC